MPIPRRLPALLLAISAVLMASCSSSDEASPQDQTTTSAAAPSGGDPAYAEPGDHEVGTRTIALDDGRRVVVWYPADDDAADQPTETFDIASLLTPELQAEIPAELRPQYEIDAHVGAAPATDGPFPVVLFSHGYAGFPEQSADLVTHLASWGMVVVAPDHVERSLAGLLGTAGRGVEPREDPEVLSASLDAALADGQDASSPLHELLDPDAVAVAGHSAGASAAYLLAGSDERIDGVIAYSLGSGRPDPETGEVPARPVPEVPGMVMVGSADAIIEAPDTIEVYDQMDPPKYLVEIADAGHLVFSDICLIGRDQGGLVALVEEAGLDLGDELLRLASDGCEPDALDPADAFGAIDQFSVSFLRWVFGLDPEPVGLDQATADTFDTAEVTVTVDEG